jgi:alpha-galactosidase
MAFYLQFERKTQNGVEDLYPLIHQVVKEGRVPDWNRVRYEMLERLGYFVTESSEHFAEYTPYFIKRDRPDLVQQFNVPLDEYIKRCELQIAAWKFMQKEMQNPGSLTEEDFRSGMVAARVSPMMLGFLMQAFKEMDQVIPSHEYGSLIIHSIETGKQRVIYGNVPNQGLIDNLPQDCIVEVPCLVDKNGVQPTRIGALPPQLAALIQTNVNVQSLTVEAAITRQRKYIYYAAMLDPHTAAELDLDQIWHLVDDLLEAHQGWLPEYS